MKPGVDYVGIATPFFAIDQDRYLALHRRTAACRDEHGHWDAGSGQLEFGREPAENALAELAEEYGCTGTIIDTIPPHVLIREHESDTTCWLLIPFFIRVRRSDVTLREPHKHTDLTWATLSTLPEPLHTGFAYVLERYRDRFEKHLRG
ncbi:MAG: NUDIX domain-containing protein [Candidatus Woesearchaeota archaeon]